MGGPQQPDAQSNVVSTVALVLEQFVKAVQQNIPGVRCVYDEQLTYESASAKVRADNSEDKTSQKDLFPLFAFKRSVLRYASDGMGRRATTTKARLVADATHSFKYTPVSGELDVTFAWFSRGLEDLERFEVAYLAEEGISGTKELTVDLTTELQGIQPPEGFKYFVKWEPFDDKTFNTSNSDYKVIQGKATIRGWYLTFAGTSPHIKTITLTTQSFLRQVLAVDVRTVP